MLLLIRQPQKAWPELGLDQLAFVSRLNEIFAVLLFIYVPPRHQQSECFIYIQWKQEKKEKKKSTLNKSSPEIDSITWAAKQVKKSQKFQAQNSDAAALFQGRNTLHLNSAVPTDTICRKSIINWKRVAFIVNAFHHFSAPIYMSLLYAQSWTSLGNRETIQIPSLMLYRTIRNSVPSHIHFLPFVVSANNNCCTFTLKKTVAYICTLSHK